MTWPLRYCPDCASRLAEKPEGNALTCPSCGAVHYLNARPCAGVLVERDGRVLLARRAREPRKGTWDIVGGFLEPDEHPADGAVREVLEETGLEVKLGEVFAMLIDTYGDENLYTLNIYYRASAPDGEPVPTSDVSELRWFLPDELPEELAFPHEHQLLARWTAAVAGGAKGMP